MTLKNVQTIAKIKRSSHGNKDVFEKSSDIVVFSLFEQSWDTLVKAGLSHVFNDDQAEFESRKRIYEMEVTENATKNK